MRFALLNLSIGICLFIQGCMHVGQPKISSPVPSGSDADDRRPEFEKSDVGLLRVLLPTTTDAGHRSVVLASYNIGTSPKITICTLDGDEWIEVDLFVYAIGTHQWMRQYGEIHVPHFTLPQDAQREWRQEFSIGGAFHRARVNPGESIRHEYDLTKEFGLDLKGDYAIYVADINGFEQFGSCLSLGSISSSSSSSSRPSGEN